MSERNLELALRIRTLVQGSENVDDLRQGMGGLADELEQTGEEAQKAGQQFDGLEQSEKKVGEGADDAKKGMEGLHGAVGELVGKLGEMVAITVVAERFISANEEARKLGLQFRAMTGDTEKAADELGYIREVANRWGVEVDALAPAYLRLAAATKGSRAEGDATRKMIDDLSAAYINAGAAADDIEESMEILGERFAEGTVSVADLKEGMQEDMPPAIQAATTAVLENNAALQQMLETGSAATEDFMPAFAAALREYIGGSSDKVETLGAAFVRMGADVNQMMVDINAKIPIMDLLVGALNKTATGVEVVTRTISGGASLLSDMTKGFVFVGEAVGTAVAALAQGDDALAAVAEQAAPLNASLGDTALHLLGIDSAAQKAAETQAHFEKSLQQAREEADPYQTALDKINHRLEDAQQEFKNTGDAVKLTEMALEEFFKAPEKNLDAKGVMNLAAALQVVSQNAKGAGEEISATLGASLTKLTNEQLTALEAQARKAMAAAGGDESARKIFADLGQVIEGAVLARLEKLGVDGKEALTGISDEADEAINNFTALANNADLSADVIEKAFEGTLAKLDSPEELETLKQELIKLGAEGKMSFAQVSSAVDYLQQRISDASRDPALERQARQMQQVADKARDYTNALQDVADSQIDGIRADRDKAAALGATAIVQFKSVELARAEAEWAQKIAAAKQVEIAAEQALLQAKIAVLKSGGLKTEQDRQEYAGLQLQNAALGMQADAIKTAADAKGIAAGQAGLHTNATNTNTTAVQQNTGAQEQQAKVVDNTGKHYQRLLDMLQGARDRTKELSEAAGAYFEMMLQGELNAKGLQGAFGASAAAAQAFEKAVEGGGGELAKFETEAANARAAHRDLKNEMLFTVNMLDTYETAIGMAEAATKAAFYEQSAQAERYRLALEDVVKTGKNLGDAPYLLEEATKAANDEFKLLDEQDLSGLRSAIDSANNKLREMQDEADAAQARMLELDARLARAKGNTDEADRLDDEKKRLEEMGDVEKRLAEAREQQNQEQVRRLEEEKRKLDEVLNAEKAELENKIKAKKDNANADTSPSGGRGDTTTTTTTNVPSGGGGTTVNLSINMPNAMIADRRALDDLAHQLQPSLNDISRRLR